MEIPGESMILLVQCGENHLSQTNVDGNNNLAGPMVNGVVDSLQNELEIDHCYLPKLNLILVKIDEFTINNQVLTMA